MDLIKACKKGDAAAVRVALTKNPDSVHFVDKRMKSTPLGVAVAGGHTSVVQMLLDAGGDPSVRNRMNMNALHQACMRADEATAAALLASGKCDVNEEAMQGNTPLHVAAPAKKLTESFVRLLCAHGAHAARANGKGKTAADLVKDAGIAALLRDVAREQGDTPRPMPHLYKAAAVGASAPPAAAAVVVPVREVSAEDEARARVREDVWSSDRAAAARVEHAEVASVQEWLERVAQLPQYVARFRKFGFDRMAMLDVLTDGTLEDMGVKPAHRTWLLKCVAERAQPAAAAAAAAAATPPQEPAKEPVVASWRIARDDLSLDAQLGRGAFGEVWKGTWRGTTAVAVKRLRAAALAGAHKAQFEREVQVMASLPPHPNVVSFLGVCESGDELLLVTEFMPHGSLDELLRAHGAGMDAFDMLHMATQIAAGMDHLHANALTHRDLAARNLLVDKREGRYIIKVADFGLSATHDAPGATCFPVKWTAPEAMASRVFTPANDVWAFGVVLWEIFAHGAEPYKDMDGAAVKKGLAAGYRMPAPMGCPPAVASLMQRCWHTTPEQRPSFRDAHKALVGAVDVQPVEYEDF